MRHVVWPLVRPLAAHRKSVEPMPWQAGSASSGAISKPLPKWPAGAPDVADEQRAPVFFPGSPDVACVIHIQLNIKDLRRFWSSAISRPRPGCV